MMALNTCHPHAGPLSSAFQAAPQSAASHPRRSRQTFHNQVAAAHTHFPSSFEPPLISRIRHSRELASTSCSLEGSSGYYRAHSRGVGISPSLAHSLQLSGIRQCRRRSRRCTPLAAVKQERLPPGETSDIGDSSGGFDQFFSSVTGFPFPIGPNLVRRTIRYEVEKDRVWTFEQPQTLAFTNVTTSIRMTVVRLSNGGLFVYSPVAPTRECVALLRELGRVDYIILSTHAYEHKLFIGPFSRKFPSAKVYIAPHQWSFPLDLPVQTVGIFPAGVLNAGEAYPWDGELDFRIFTANLAQGSTGDIGSLTEVAFFHKPSRTLLLTDSVIMVPSEPPAVVQRKDLLLAGGNPWYCAILYGFGKKTLDTIEAAQSRAAKGTAPSTDPEIGRILLGWQRMCLLVLCLMPDNLLDPNDSFASFSKRLTISPVVERLVFSKVPGDVAEWVEDICSSWNFKRIIPCHLAAPISAGPQDLRETFAFAYQNSSVEVKSGWLGFKWPAPKAGKPAFPDGDVAFLRGLSSTLNKLGLIVEDRVL